jgi:Tol biopolymer transport system component
VIPLEAGNLSVRGLHTYAVESSGRRVLYSPDPSEPNPLTVIDRETGLREIIPVPLTSNEGVKFSGDGAYLFFKAIYPNSPLGLWSLDLATNEPSLISSRASFFFNVSHDGGRVAFQEAGQFHLYDRVSDQRQQITDYPDAIPTGGTCPAQFGTTPLITADGTKVFLTTSATLGLADSDPAIGCRIFSYDVADKALEQVVALPNTWRALDIPALSADGRWLSFVVIAPGDDDIYRGTPALLDTSTGETSAPVVDVGPFTSFDSVITADGNGLVFSTQGDLDARVGNADHNLELFYLDRTTGVVSQMTETVGGIGRTPGNCASRRPAVSRDGSVTVFAGYPVFSVEGCQLDGPQHNEFDGLTFGFARAIRKRPGNTEVTLEVVSEQRAVAGDTLTIALRAHDSDRDPITFFAQLAGTIDMPPGAVITDHHDGTATVEWPTILEDVGTHVLRVAAFDEGGGERVRDVTIKVVPRDRAGCAGDCDETESVTIDELVALVGVALGTMSVDSCASGDADGDRQVTIDEILTAVDNLLLGC